MACSLNTVAVFGNISAVKSVLLTPDSFRDEETSHKGYKKDDGDWDWPTWMKTDTIAGDPNDEDWLKSCVVAISPVGDLLIIARASTVVFLSLKWDNHEKGEVKNKFSMVWSKTLGDEPGDVVTALCCVPLASQKRSLYGLPDWTCIMIGFSSGHLKMYTEAGILLTSHIFSNGPVLGIKCRTFGFETRSSNVRQSDDLVLLYESALVVVDGTSLYYTLGAVRNRVAKASASGTEAVQDVALNFKKWSLSDCGDVRDCVYVGESSPTMFDQLVNESIRTSCAGSSSASRVPVHAQFSTCGSKPYLGFYYAMESLASPLMMDISVAASALKSIVKGVFFGSKTSEPTQAKMEPGVPLKSRYDILDSSRSASSVTPSPDYRFSAVSDDFGRVIVFDNLSGLAVRMFKGYREAQCGWVEEQEDVSHSEKQNPIARIALFLVIYAPKRGILEVWLMQNGPRVAAFNIGKHSRLYFPGHKIMGPGGKGESSVKQLCSLINPDGSVRIIEVPFHCALSDKFSKHARDLHLLRNLNEALKSHAAASTKCFDEIAGFILDMKTPSVKQQAIDKLLALDLGHEVLLQVIQGLIDQMGEHDLDLESKLLRNCCLRAKQLLDTYRGIKKLSGFREDAASREDRDDTQLRMLSSILRVTESEAVQLVERVNRYLGPVGGSQQKPGVKFSDEWLMTAGQFVRSFETNARHLPKDDVDYFPLKDLHVVTLRPGLTEEDLVPLGRFLYRHCLEGNAPIADVEYTVKCSGIQPEALLNIFLSYWLSLREDIGVTDRVINCCSVLKFICDVKGSSSIVMEDSSESESPWWLLIREQLSRSTNVLAALVAAVASRGIAVSLATELQKESLKKANENVKEREANGGTAAESVEEVEKDRSDRMVASIGEWEEVDMDTFKLSMMVRQMEDLLAVSAFLSYRPPDAVTGNGASAPAVSLSVAIEKGRGFVSEVVAQRLVSLDVDIARVLRNEDADDQATFRGTEDQVEEAKEASTQQQEICEVELQSLLTAARYHFPYSLESNVLLANCCWDLAARWNKDPNDLGDLRKAVSCLSDVNDGLLRQGMAAFIWQKFLKARFTSAVTLLEKVGKVPKDRLCRKDIGMSDMNVGEFMSCCISVLSLLLEGFDRRKSEVIPPSERFPWEDFWQQVTGPTPLIQLAVSAKRPSALLVEIHHQLAMACQMAFAFNVKPVKPLSMFRGAAKKLFFQDLHCDTPYDISTSDEIVQDARTKYLFEVITAAVMTVPEPNLAEGETENFESPLKTSRTDAGRWIRCVMSLAQDWKLEMPALQKKYVCELYRSGLDSVAEEVLPSIADKTQLASQLLEIAGHRVKQAIAGSGNRDGSSEKRHSLFPPTATDWMNGLGKSTLRCTDPPLRLTALLVNTVIHMIPDGHPKYRLAIGLVEPIQALMDMAELDAII